MSNKTSIVFIIVFACILVGSFRYQKTLDARILYMESILLSEDRAHFEKVDRIKVAVKDKIKMRSVFTDSFSFIFPLFEVFDSINPCNNRSSEINALVDRVAENTVLGQINSNEYSSTLEVFEVAFKLILASVDSIHLSQKPKRVPALVVEEYYSSMDSCVVKMCPLFSIHMSDSVKVFDKGIMLDVDSLPFRYDGLVNGLRVITKNGEQYDAR